MKMTCCTKYHTIVRLEIEQFQHLFFVSQGYFSNEYNEQGYFSNQNIPGDFSGNVQRVQGDIRCKVLAALSTAE